MWEESKHVRYRFLNIGSGVDDGFGNIIFLENRISFDAGLYYLGY